MVTFLGALALSVAVTPVPAGLEEAVSAVRAGVPAEEIAARVRASGIYVPLNPEQALRLYLDDVPASVLAAAFATSGSEFPKVSGSAGQLELLYDGYRIVGRQSPTGPLLAVSGFGRDGARLKPPVVEPAAPVTAAPSVEHVDSYRTSLRELPEGSVTGAVAVPEPRMYLPSSDQPVESYRRGAPEFVSVTQVPLASITGGSVVLPLGAGVAYGYPGCGPYASPGYLGGGYVTYGFGPPAGGGRRQSSGQQPGPGTRVVRDRITR